MGVRRQLPVGAQRTDASGLSYFSVVDAPGSVMTLHTDSSQLPRYFAIPGVADAEAITVTLWYRHTLMEPFIVAAHETVETGISWCVHSIRKKCTSFASAVCLTSLAALLCLL